jgi:peptide/nickel transport system substrate-binding protein
MSPVFRSRISLWLVCASLLLSPFVGASRHALAGSVQHSKNSATSMVARLVFGGFGGGSNPQRNFNPYSPNQILTGYTFEPLFALNDYKGVLVPWLATSYHWQGAKLLVFTVRHNVKWSDGQSFTAQDVAFTFNLFKKFPALDTNGLWKFLSSVTAQGDQVSFKYSQASIPTLNQVATTLIVPAHTWAKAGDPVVFTNPNPVGTGPFTVKSFNGEQVILQRNPRYWQAKNVRVNQLEFDKSTNGDQIQQLLLGQGKFDQNSMYVPDIQKVYISKDPKHNHYWFPPGGVIGLYMNVTKAPFNDVALREAIAYAIDRKSIAVKAEFGYVKAASQTGLVLPGQKAWLDPTIKNQGYFGYQPKQAAAILSKAGYKKNSDGKLLGKDGKPVSFTFEVENGWTDWVAASQIVQQNLTSLGMAVNVQTPSPDSVMNDQKLGNFDMGFGVYGGSPSQYQNFDVFLNSSHTAPVGQKADSNVIRWKNAATDQLLNQLRSSIVTQQQKKIVYKLEQIMVKQFPAVGLWYGAQWFEYSTRHAVGWPDDQHPYASPGDGLLIITHLRPSNGK